MKELLIATANRGKFGELELLLRGAADKLYSLADFPHLPPPVEDGATFTENAIKKARVAAAATGKPAIADDSGLVVDALNGAPGVFSARFAGEGASDADNNDKLLTMLRGVPAPRSAAFCCVVAFCSPDGLCRTFDGQLHGMILDSYRGSGGFGYDPLFLVPEYGKTLAELSIELKSRISHRGLALAKLMGYLMEIDHS